MRHRHGTVAQSNLESRDNGDMVWSITVCFTTIVTWTPAISSNDNHLLSGAGPALSLTSTVAGQKVQWVLISLQSSFFRHLWQKVLEFAAKQSVSSTVLRSNGKTTLKSHRYRQKLRFKRKHGITSENEFSRREKRKNGMWNRVQKTETRQSSKLINFKWSTRNARNANSSKANSKSLEVQRMRSWEKPIVKIDYVVK
jgi:hypothetical protein